MAKITIEELYREEKYDTRKFMSITKNHRSLRAVVLCQILCRDKQRKTDPFGNLRCSKFDQA